ncbi:MAG: hypothetical protein ACWGHV_08105 [Stutzerimonas stutzeri]
MGRNSARCIPASKHDFKSALFTPVDGRAEPQKAAPAIAEAARDKGAHILTQLRGARHRNVGRRRSAAW